MMAKKLGIIADDLTGANDSGVQLAKKGLTATVVLDFTQKAVTSKPDVLIIDTDSRAKTRKEAYEAVVQAASLLSKKGYRHVYKKVDSTLRGNIAAELAALEKVYQPDITVIAPAFPKLKRTTVSGRHYVGGELITETEFSRDPKTPVTESYLPDLMADKEKETVLIDLSMLRGPSDIRRRLIEEALAGGQTRFVCDAATEADLQTIATVFAGLEKKAVWVGSGGLAEYLPEALKLVSDRHVHDQEMNIQKTLIVSGSLSEVTKKQLSAIEKLEDAFLLEIDPVQLVKNNPDWNGIMEQAAAHFNKQHFVIYVDSSAHQRTAAKKAGDEMGYSEKQVGAAIARGLGEIAQRLVQTFPEINGLVLTGGDIAKAVCSVLGIHEMELYAEVEPGLPFGRLQGQGKHYWAVTKAGGFGNEQSLVNALHYMSREVEFNESK